MYIQEQRISDRFFVNSAGCAIINGRNIDLKTHDVSQGGALVEFPERPSLKQGMRLRLHLNIGFLGSAIICRVTTRDDSTLYGLKFERFDFYSDLVLNAYFVKYAHHLAGSPTIH